MLYIYIYIAVPFVFLNKQSRWSRSHMPELHLLAIERSYCMEDSAATGRIGKVRWVLCQNLAEERSNDCLAVRVRWRKTCKRYLPSGWVNQCVCLYPHCAHLSVKKQNGLRGKNGRQTLEWSFSSSFTRRHAVLQIHEGFWHILQWSSQFLTFWKTNFNYSSYPVKLMGRLVSCSSPFTVMKNSKS